MSQNIMNSDILPQENAKSTSNRSCKSRNNRRWDSHKDEIRGIYVEEKTTLLTTMQKIEDNHGFKARQVITPILSC